MDWREVDGWIVYEDGLRVRPINGGGGGGSTKTVSQTIIPEKTAEEKALLGKQNELLGIQVEQLKRQNDALAELFPSQKELFQAQTRLAIESTGLQSELARAALEELKGTPEEQEIRRLSNERALAILRGEAPPISAAQAAQIDTIFGESQREGEESLTRYGQDLAAARGLTVADSPIGNELIRERANLGKSLSASKAAAKLDLGAKQQVFQESVRQFQEGLRQNAAQNRLALLGNASAVGQSRSPVFASLDPTQTFSAITPLVGTLANERIAGATNVQKSNFQTYPGVFDYFKAIVGAVGAAAGAAAASSVRFKKDIVPYDQDEYDAALAKMRATPVTRWKYRHEDDSVRPHTGPILELSPDDIKASDTHLDLLSYSGMLHASLKAVDRKVDRVMAALEAA